MMKRCFMWEEISHIAYIHSVLEAVLQFAELSNAVTGFRLHHLAFLTVDFGTDLWYGGGGRYMHAPRSGRLQ